MEETTRGEECTGNESGGSKSSHESPIAAHTFNESKNIPTDKLEDVPMEIDSSHIDVPKASLQSLKSLSISRLDNESSRNDREIPSTSIDGNREDNIMENLQDRLTTMRDGFLER